MKLFLTILLSSVISVFAQSHGLLTPVHIGISNGPILDEYSQVLKGSSAIDSSKCDLILVLNGEQGIYPPSYNGMSHTDNPALPNGQTRIGNLVSPFFLNPGIVSVSLANPRPQQNDKLFLRAFNASTIEGASFYSDSQILIVKNNNVLYAEMAPIQPIDPRDFDVDGLNNSWEKSLGSNPYEIDTDGDGVIDSAEFIAGTDLLDIEDYLKVRINRLGLDVLLSWNSVIDRFYRVE